MVKKVAFVTAYDALNVRNWSGIARYMVKALEAHSIEVQCLGPLIEHRALLYKIKQAAYRAVLGKRHLRHRELAIVRAYAEQVARKLKDTDADIVFSPGSIPISYLECRQPIVFWTDATFAGMVDFYPEFSNLSNESLRNGNLIEQSALSRSRLAIYSSEWAARTAVDNYQVDSAEIQVVPFGANIDENRTLQDIERIVSSRSSATCTLLFVGVDWKRKGGEVALEIAKELNFRGLKTELIVVGCKPALSEPMPHFLKVAGFIDKGTREGQERLSALIARSHFLVLPTEADCTPIVFSEANSLGVPCLTSDVGGITSVIRDNLNGRTFSSVAEPSEYCDYILDLMANRARYRQLASSSFNEYKIRLNWGVAGETIKSLLEECCAG